MTKEFGGNSSRGAGARIGGLALALAASTAIYTAGTLFQPAHAQQVSTISYSIPAGPLGSAISRFGDRSDLQVLYPAALVQGKASPGVSGTLSREVALDRLLAGTGLSWSFTNADTVTIVDPASASAGGTVAADGSIMLDTITIQGSSENPWGQTDGYVATQSAATKTSTPIIEIPQSVSVVTRQQLADQKPTTIRQALTYTPGVSSEYSSTNANFDFIRVRGFAVTDYMMLDGLRQPTAAANTFLGPRVDPYMLERVEVLTVATDALKRGTSLVVTANPDGGGEQATFTVSLSGFTAAMSRVAELAE